MNKFKKIIFMDKETWVKRREQGLRKYLFITGFIKLGTLVGILTITMIYLNDLDHELKVFNIKSYLQDYVLLYYPITLVVGLVMAWLTWLDFENRFGGKSNR